MKVKPERIEISESTKWLIMFASKKRKQKKVLDNK